MIEVAISADMLVEARDKAAEMGRLHNSITRGQGNLAGFLGEAIAQHVLGGTLANTYEYDLIMGDGATVDVKTKLTSVKPLDTYSCSVAKLNTKQECDYYAFTRIKNDYSVGWFLGVCSKKRYYEEAIFMAKGTVDQDNKYVVRSDCYNLAIYMLDSVI
jgi:hypothetical protein